VDNQELGSLLGEGDIAPDVAIISSADCLSVLDRRYLVEDGHLVSEGYGSESGEGVLSLLEGDMSSIGVREKRYSWLNIRVDPVRGTLARASRARLVNLNEAAIKDLKNSP